MQVSVIGAGRSATAHLRALSLIKDIKLEKIYDINYDRAKYLTSMFGGTPVKHLDALVQSCDAIIIASPNHMHADHSLKALQHEKHILCEKPMSASLSQAEDMFRFSYKSSVRAFVGFNYRQLPIASKIKELIQEDFFSEIITCSIKLIKSSALTRQSYTWRESQESLCSSGALGDLGSHLFDLMHFWLKDSIDYSSLRGKLQTFIPEKENRKVYVDDYCYVHGRLRGGTYFDLLSSKSSLPADTGLYIHIVGTKNELFYASNNANCYYTKSSYHWLEHEISHKEYLKNTDNEINGWSDSFYLQLKSWIDHIQGVTTSSEVATFEDGLYVQKAIDILLQKFVSTIHHSSLRV